MIIKWKSSDGRGNFGDEIGELLKAFASPAALRTLLAEDTRFFLLGSVINESWLKESISQVGAEKVFYWGCGFRGERIAPELLNGVNIRGVRGLETQRYLTHQGIQVEAIGDTALLLPLLFDKPTTKSGSIFIPHILDKKRHSYEAEDLGVDEIIQPDTGSIDEVIDIIRRIAGARFVLAGAMHAGIVACAYDVPFAFYGSSRRDSPVKYVDFLSIFGRDLYPEFVTNTREGWAWHRKNARRLRRVSLLRILKAAPFPVRRKYLSAAHRLDVRRRLGALL